jgi:hypothetical protein
MVLFRNHINYASVRFGVVTSVYVKITTFWYILEITDSLLDNLHFGRICLRG